MTEIKNWICNNCDWEFNAEDSLACDKCGWLKKYNDDVVKVKNYES